MEERPGFEDHRDVTGRFDSVQHDTQPLTDNLHAERSGGVLGWMGRHKKGLGVTAVLGAGAIVVAPYVRDLMDGIVGQVASPEDSQMEAATVAIRPVSFDCRSFTVFEHDGSAARTKYNLAGMELDFTGYGAVMEEGRSVMQTCATEPNITVEEATIDGKPGKEVQIPLSSLAFTGFFNEGDTTVIRADPALSQFGGGLFDMGSAAAEAACSVVTFGQADEECEALNTLSRWNAENQADLARSLRVAVLKETQEECAPLEWENQKLAITDSYRQQAVDQGFDPYSVSVRFVDDAGMEAGTVPDFTKSTLEELYAEGILKEEGDGPAVEYSGVHCTQLEGGYQAKFPNKP